MTTESVNERMKIELIETDLVELADASEENAMRELGKISQHFSSKRCPRLGNNLKKVYPIRLAQATKALLNHLPGSSLEGTDVFFLRRVFTFGDATSGRASCSAWSIVKLEDKDT